MFNASNRSRLWSSQWKIELSQTVIRSPLSFDPHVLLITRPTGKEAAQSYLVALDQTSGERRWRISFQDVSVSGLCQYQITSHEKGLVVALSSDDFLHGYGSLVAFDGEGNRKWVYQRREQIYSAPATSAERLFLTTGSRSLLILDPETPETSEQIIPLPVAPSGAAPLVDEGMIYVPCRSAELAAIDEEGDIHWRVRGRLGRWEWLDQTPAAMGDRLFTVSARGTTLALDRESGRILWQVNVGRGRPLSRPTVYDDRLYVGGRQGLTAVDARNGRILWRFSTDRPVVAAPVAWDDIICFVSEDHHLYALDRDKGDELGRYEFPRRIEMAPLLTEQSLIVADRGGTVVSYGISSSQPARKRQLALRYEEGENHREAAALWRELDEIERAARQYEQAKEWAEAARLWRRLERYERWARVLERYAKSLTDRDLAPEELAQVWAQAARAYAQIDAKEARRRCEVEAAYYRQTPMLTVDIEPPHLQVRAWSQIAFTVRNKGFGVARELFVDFRSDQFEGQTAQTQTVIMLVPERGYNNYLNVRPLAYGSRVPLHIILEYVDNQGRSRKEEHPFYLEVERDRPSSRFASSSWDIPPYLPVSVERLRQTRRKLVRYLGREEILTLIFDLGLNQDLFGDGVGEMTRNLLVYLARNDRLDELISLCRQYRPDVEW